MRITVNGKKLFFDVEGDALHHDGSGLQERPTLILLHGSPGNSDHTVFKPMFSALTDVAQVVYLDLAGCGRSDDPVDAVFSLEAWADDLVEFCHVLGIEKPVVLGNSAGGMVAIVYGSRHPEHPGKLILSSTQARLVAERCLTVFERLGGPEAREVARRALVTECDGPSFVDYARTCMKLYNQHAPKRPRLSTHRPLCAGAFHHKGGIWQSMDLFDHVRSITCPTMILVGDDDPVTPLQDSGDIRDCIAPELVRFERFANAGHGVWLDSPDRAFSVIRDFVTS